MKPITNLKNKFIMQQIEKMTEWIFSIEVDQVKVGEIDFIFTPSMRTLVTRYNNTRGRQKNIYVHMSYIYDSGVAVLVSEPRDDYENKKSKNYYANEWKKKIPTHFD